MTPLETALNAGWRTLAAYNTAVLFGDPDTFTWAESLASALGDIIDAVDDERHLFADRYGQ